MEDDARGVADVLDPAETVAGVDGVRRAVRKARQVWLVSDSEALAPCRLTKRAARALLDRIAAGGEVDGPDGVRPVVVTARVEGPDAIIRTLEWLGDASRLGRPTDPMAAVASRGGKKGCALLPLGGGAGGRTRSSVR